MDGTSKRDTRTVEELVRAFVSLELEMTNDVPTEWLRLNRQNHVCIELTARSAWSEAGPLIDREIAQLRDEFRGRG
jgi:hypothetical protein